MISEPRDAEIFKRAPGCPNERHRQQVAERLEKCASRLRKEKVKFVVA